MPECVASKRFVRGRRGDPEVSRAYGSFPRVRRPWAGAPLPGLDIGAILVTALLLAALFAGDSFWMAAVVLLAASGWGALALTGRAPAPRGMLLLGLLLATAAWSGLSIVWSIAPDRSWDELNRTLVLAGFLALGLLFGALRGGACRRAAALLGVALGAAVLWALAGKVVPALFPDGARAARLRDPVGYWNALALAADALLVLGLWAAVSIRARAPRVAGTVLAYAAVLAIFLSVSRTGLAAAVAGVALWLWLARERLSAAALALAAALPACAVAAWAFTRPALVEAGQAARRPGGGRSGAGRSDRGRGDGGGGRSRMGSAMRLPAPTHARAVRRRAGRARRDGGRRCGRRRGRLA